MWQGIQTFLLQHRRKIGVGLVMAFVIITPYLVLSVVQHFRHPNLHAATDCTPNAVLVNPCRPWLGAWAVDYPEAQNGVKNQILYHEQRIGKQIDLVKDYKTAGGTLGADDKYFINRPNTYALITWKPAGSFGAGASASANSSIDTMAASVKSVAPKKIFLSIWHEPENDVNAGTTSCGNAAGNAGSPAQYVAMWQNVRNRFDAAGVNNVVWTYIPMGYSGWNCMEKQLWPGNNLVDWVMWDPYGSGDSDSWNKTMSPFYDWMTANTDAAHAYTSKAWGIAETSIHWYSQEASGVAFWQGAKAALDANTFPRLKAYVVFDSTNGKPDNRVGYWCKAWVKETCNAGQTVADPAKAAAYKAFANDAVFNVTSTGGGGGGGDTTPPTVSVTAPANGATVSGNITASATASDSGGISKVVFAVDGAIIATDTTQPFSSGIDTTKYTNANHTITATAYDAAGNNKAQAVTITVKNTTPPPPPPSDTTPPVATITSPANGATVSKSITLAATATDDVQVAKVVFTVDGNIVATDMTNPYSTPVDTTLYTNGSHILRAKTYDAAGNIKTPQVTVTVANTTPPANPTILSFTANPVGVTVGETSTLKWTSANAVNCSVNPNGPQNTTLSTWTSAPYTSTGTKTYTLTCYNSVGKTATATASVTVSAAPTPPAKPMVSADKTTVVKGGQVLISWSSSGASNCILNPGTISSSGATGSKLVTNLQQTTTFTVTCTNTAGNSSGSVLVTVSTTTVQLDPIINTFTAQPTAVTSGATTTLSWSSSNVASNGCSITPSPLTSAAANGTWQSGPLTASTSYTLTCKNSAGKSVSKSASVTVNGAPAPEAPPATPSDDTPITSDTVEALGGQSIVNAQSDGTVDQGELVTLDPSNVLDEKKALSIVRVEYYNNEKLIQTVNEPPYALNTKVLAAGTYTITERTYYEDGSVSERTQDITVKETAATTVHKSHSWVAPVVWTIIVLAIAGLAAFIARRIQISRSEAAYSSSTTFNSDELIVSPSSDQSTTQTPDETESDQNTLPPVVPPQA
jgi:YD repeat-containing protein